MSIYLLNFYIKFVTTPKNKKNSWNKLMTVSSSYMRVEKKTLKVLPVT